MSKSNPVVTKNLDGTWLHIEAPSGRKASINLEVIGIERKGLIGSIILEWVDSLPMSDTEEVSHEN